MDLKVDICMLYANSYICSMFPHELITSVTFLARLLLLAEVQMNTKLCCTGIRMRD